MEIKYFIHQVFNESNIKMFYILPLNCIINSFQTNIFLDAYSIHIINFKTKLFYKSKIYTAYLYELKLYCEHIFFTNVYVVQFLKIIK